MSPQQRFLWFVGGFDRQVLEMEGCRSIRSKYSSIGGLILMTALLAVCSGGYAVYTITDSLLGTAPIAVAWGMFILLLDRYLISSDRKLATIREFHTSLQVTPPYHETWRWGALAVRLLLSGFIGVVVAKPIEMAILEPWILEYYRDQDDADAARRKQASELARQDDDIAARKKALEERQRQIDRRRQVLSDEIGGIAGKSSGKVGDGPIAAAQRKLLEQAEAEHERDSKILDGDIAEREKERKRVADDALAGQRARLESRSVISDMGAIREIELGGGNKATLVSIVSIFLSLFFVIIEITPVLAKAISRFDPYDAVLLEREHESILGSLTRARQAHGHAFAQVAEP